MNLAAVAAEAGKLSPRMLMCAAVVACASMSANAATTALGPVTPGLPTSFQGTVVPAGAFNDIFTFSLPANLGSGYSVLNFPVTLPGIGTLNTILATASLISNPDGILFNADDVTLTSVTSALPGQSVNNLHFTFGPTGGGNMYLNVTGLTSGTLGGLYNGSISVTPVPEPEIWATLLVGTGLVGFQLRRKRKAAEANRLAVG